MLTQSYFTHRMDYPHYTTTGTYYPSSFGVYPITPPYTYDHQLSYFGRKSINVSPMFLDRPNQPLDFYFSSVAQAAEIGSGTHQILPSPPLSVSSSASPPVVPYPKNGVPPTTSYHLAHYNQEEERSIFNASNGSSSSSNGSAPFRKSVIMKIEDRRIMESMGSSVESKNQSDSEEEFICKWDLCYR